jgi:hypothetical protein
MSSAAAHLPVVVGVAREGVRHVGEVQAAVVGPRVPHLGRAPLVAATDTQ